MGKIQIWGQTAAAWALDNPILAGRQPGLETDTRKVKYGDGVTAWNALLYSGVSGTAFVDITGSPNDNALLDAALDAKADRESELLTGGLITVETIDGTGTLNDIRVTASTFFIVGSGNHSAIETPFLNIALSAANKLRWIDIYGKTDNTVVKVEGVEGSTAVHPSAPANSVLIGSVLVSDAGTVATPAVGGYTLAYGAGGAATPADSTNYAIGMRFGSVAPVFATYEALAYGMVVPATGTIKYITLTVGVYSTIGSSESATLSLLRYSSTGTLLSTTVISTAVKFNPSGANPSIRYNFSGLSLSVNASDILAFMVTTPVWATNPTNVFFLGNIYIE
jgi:hypothetical protein